MLALRIDRQIEEQFRKTIGERRGIQRGNLKNALEEAIAMWTQMHQKVDNIRARRAYKEMVTKAVSRNDKRPCDTKTITRRVETTRGKGETG